MESGDNNDSSLDKEYILPKEIMVSSSSTDNETGTISRNCVSEQSL